MKSSLHTFSSTIKSVRSGAIFSRGWLATSTWSCQVLLIGGQTITITRDMDGQRTKIWSGRRRRMRWLWETSTRCQSNSIDTFSSRIS
jgi:hypothetical protein